MPVVFWCFSSFVYSYLVYEAASHLFEELDYRKYM